MKGRNMKDIARQYTIFGILIVLIIVLGILSPNFLTMSNMITIARQISMTAIMGVGLSIVLISHNFDISIGSIMSFTTVFCALLIVQKGFSPIPAILISMTVCVGFGLINGIVVAKAGVPALIVTLAMQQIVQGIAYILCKGLPIYGLPPGLKQISQGHVSIIPIPVIIMIVILALGSLFLRKTYLGRYVYAVGSNADAAKLSGINVNGIRIGAFALNAFLACIAGVIMLGRVNSGQPTVGSGYDMDVLAGVVLGGISLNGGKGTIMGAFAGILIIGVLSNGLVILGIDEFVQLLVKGLVLLIAVIVDGIQTKSAAKTGKPTMKSSKN